MLRNRRVRYGLKLIILFGIYFVTARIGLSLDAVNRFATLVWPPTGIALVATLILGYRVWPAIALAAFSVNLVTGAPFLVALGIGAGNTVEALTGAYLVKRFANIRLSFDQISDVTGIVVFGALLSTALGATIGVTSLLAGNVISAGQYGATWLAWWIGDMLGDLVIAPLLLVWRQRTELKLKPRRIIEGGLSWLLLVLTAILVFRGIPSFGVAHLRFTYVIFPALVWIALRFGMPSTTLATLLVAVIAIWSTVAGYGPFAINSASHGLLLLQTFVGITAVTFMFMSAVVSQYRYAQKHQQLLLRRASRLVKQRTHLMSLNQTKDEFVAIASHQLRTPATAVKQYLGLLLEGYTEPLTDDQRSFLEKAYENNDRQLKIVDDLLRVAQLDLNKMKLRLNKQNINEIIAESANSLNQMFKDRHQKILTLIPDKPIQASVDGAQFRTVIDNLLENASNYSPENTQITLTLKKSKGNLIIIVKDDGVGIAKRDFPLLFQKFSRIRNNLSTSVNGNGLGLYLSQKIIQLHGGKITVRSAPKRGSSFIIRLPN